MKVIKENGQFVLVESSLSKLKKQFDEGKRILFVSGGYNISNQELMDYSGANDWNQIVTDLKNRIKNETRYLKSRGTPEFDLK